MVGSERARQTSELTTGWMVACAPQLQLPDSSQYMQVPAAAVDQLKQQLLSAVQNEDINGAAQVIGQLEKSPLTKEILEATRIGAAVNDVRKRTQVLHPDLSKKCRSLIKHWQKLLESTRPPSCAGSYSNSGTPNTPALRRGLTPQTPGRRGCTPRSVQVASPGPVDGSYAPNSRKCSPKETAVKDSALLIKSQSVGSELCRSESRTGGSPTRSRVKKRQLTPLQREPGTAEKKSRMGNSRDQTPTTSPPVSVLAARRQNALPTSNLVAQLSNDITPKPLTPQMPSTASSNGVHTVPASPAVSNGVHVAAKPTATRPVSVVIKERKDRERDRERSKQKLAKPVKPKHISEEDTFYASDDEDSAGSSSRSTPKVKPTDWYASLPSMETLASRAAAEPKIGPATNPRKIFVMPATEKRPQPFFVCPHTDIGLPAFREYNFKDPKRFLADPDRR